MRARFFMAAKTILLVAGVLTCVEQPALAADLQRAKALNHQGEKLLGKAEFGEAINVFTSMRESCGNHEYCQAVALFYLGRCYLEISETDAAMEFLRSANDIFIRLKSQVERAKVLNVEGRIFAARTDYAAALQQYDAAEGLLMSSAAKDDDELFWVRLNRAQVNIYLCKYDPARKDLKAAETLLRGRKDPDRVAVLREREGLIHLQKQEFQQARRSYEAALAAYKQSGNRKGIAAVLSQIGQIDEAKAEYEKALSQYAQSLDLALQFGSPVSQAVALNNMGSVHWKRGNYAQASQMYDEALKILTRITSRQMLAVTLNNMGLVQLAYGAYPAALKHFEESLRLSEQIGAPEHQAWAMHNIAWVYRDQGRFEESLSFSRRAVELAEAIQNRRLKATATLRLGNLYEYYGDFEDALKEYEQAAKIQGEIGDKLFESNTLVDWANILTRESKSGRLDQAQQKYEQALAIRRGIGAAAGEILCKFALFFLEKDQYDHWSRLQPMERKQDMDRARRLVAEAEQTVKPEDGEDLMLLTYVRGRLFLEQDPGKSLQQFQDLKTRAEAAGSLKYSFLAFVGLGLGHEKLQQWPEAEKALEQAVETAESIRKGLEPQARRQFLHGEEILGVKHILPYEALARVRMRMGKVEASWDAAESSKARSFSEKLAQRTAGSTFGVDKRLIDQLEHLEQQMGVREQQLQKCLAAQGDRTSLPQLERTRTKLNADYEALRHEIKARHPKFYEVRFPQPLSLEKCALKKDEWVLCYEVTDTGVLAYLINGPRIVKGNFRPIARKRLDALVRQFRDPMDISETDVLLDKLKAFDFSSGRELSKLLLDDVLPDLPEGAKVIVVPDDVLGLLPFETLVLSSTGSITSDKGFPQVVNAVFFGDRNLVAYSQSTTALTVARGLIRELPQRSKLLVMADPVFSDKDPRLRDATTRQAQQAAGKLPAILLMSIRNQLGLDFERLEQTQELGSFLKQTDPKATDLYEGFNAAKSLVMEQDLSPYRSIVFATHGYAGEDIPGIREPVIVLTLVNQPKDRDGFLRMSEVMSLKMNPDMVALTACQSGLGRNVSGEGSMTMGRAFQYAGARSVLMSLWSVHEEASVALVKGLFKHVRDGKKSLEALRLARSDLRKDKYDHPFFWAPFILVGDVDW